MKRLIAVLMAILVIEAVLFVNVLKKGKEEIERINPIYNITISADGEVQRTVSLWNHDHCMEYDNRSVAAKVYEFVCLHW